MLHLPGATRAPTRPRDRPVTLPLVVNESLTVPAALLTWSAARASGPGGQNVNKVASKVELRFDFAACAGLDDAVKARLRGLARNRLDAEGRLLVVSQRTRDQQRNLEDAREKVRDLVARALEPPVARKATRPTRASQRRRIEGKRLLASKKRARQGPGLDGAPGPTKRAPRARRSPGAYETSAPGSTEPRGLRNERPGLDGAPGPTKRAPRARRSPGAYETSAPSSTEPRGRRNERPGLDGARVSARAEVGQRRGLVE